MALAAHLARFTTLIDVPICWIDSKSLSLE